MVSAEFDPEVNAVYIHLKKGRVDKSEPLADNIIIDIDEKGEAIGIELLLPKQDIKISQFVYRALKVEAE